MVGDAFWWSSGSNLNTKDVEVLLAKLNIGSLLTLKAEAQGLELVSESINAYESYDIQWAMNTAKVTQLLID